MGAGASRRDAILEEQYDEGIQKLVEAATLDPAYSVKVAAYRKLKADELRKGPVNLSRAINRILLPRLEAQGFRHQFEGGGPRWKEGSALVRTNARGHEGVVYMGRTKFGKEFGLTVARSNPNGQCEYLDLSTIGLARDALRYLNQTEAGAVLERVAAAFEGPIATWLDGES